MTTAREARSWRIGAFLLAAVAIFVAVRILPVGAWLEAFQGLVRESGTRGVVAYAVVYALCAVLFVPASVLSLGAGALFGLRLGVLVVMAGASGGALLSFLLARTLLRERVRHSIGGKPGFLALDRAIAREGSRIVLLVRLSPVFPFTWVNYAFGVTAVRTVPYLLATIAGILPGVIAFVYAGHAAGSAAAGTSALTVALRTLGAVATLVVTILLARIARRAIREAGIPPDSTAQEQSQTAHEQDEGGHDTTDTPEGETSRGTRSDSDS